MNKKRVCATLGFVAFAFMLGVVNGMDHGTISTLKGAILSFSSEALGTFLLWKGGVIHI